MLARARGLFDALLAGLAALLLAALLGIVMAGVISRGVNRPFSWTDELSGFVMVWLACIGWMIATRRQAQIRIRVFQDKLPPGAWRISEVIVQLGMIVLGLVIAWRSLHLISVNWDVDAIALPISTAWMYVPLLPAGLVTAAQGAAELIRSRAPSPDREALLS